MRAFRHLRRMQMAEPALRGAAQGQAAAGARPAGAHREGGAAHVSPHPRLREDMGVSQQAGVWMLRQAMVYAGGAARPIARPRRTGQLGHRLPHHGSVRQDLPHQQVLAHGRPAQRHTQRDRALRQGDRHDVLRRSRAAWTVAQPHAPHVEHGRVDAAHTVPLRRGGRRGEGEGAAQPPGRPLPADLIAHLRGQPEGQRHHRRPRPYNLQGHRLHLRDDGGAALQGGTEELLPNQHRTGLPPL